MAKLSDSLLRRAGRVAKQAKAVQAELTRAFQDRYGVTYSDVDCDWLIDALDYGHAETPTLADCDREMLACGAPRLVLQSPPAKVEP